MANVAMTVPWTASVTLVPTMVVASLTLVMGALAGGQGGIVGRLMVTVMVELVLALPPGTKEVAPLPPALSLTGS